MTAAEGSLHTLDYRIDIAELGDLTLNPLTAEFTAAWDSFDAKSGAEPSATTSPPATHISPPR